MRGYAHLLIKSTADGTVLAALLVQELNESFFGSWTLINLRLILIVPAKEFESGIAADVVLTSNILVLLIIGIKVGDKALRKRKNDRVSQCTCNVSRCR